MGKSKQAARILTPAKGIVAGASELLALQTILKKAGIRTSTLHEFARAEDQPVFALQADGVAAIALWAKLRKLVEKTGYWPVVMGDPRGWEATELKTSPELVKTWAGFLKKRCGFAVDKSGGVTAMLLAAARKVDTDGWIKKRNGNLERGGADQGDDWADIAARAGKSLQKTRVNREFRSIFDVLSKKPIKNITVGLWPTREGWQVPPMMRFGGWNSCPQPYEHAAMLRRWKGNYDAEIVVAAGDVMEMRVGKPPKSKAAAMELALEQYAFCDDIVNQGTMTLERLAEALRGAPVWYFWWD